MNIISLKNRIEKALARVPKTGPTIVLYHCHRDADELTREQARDAALEGRDLVGPAIVLCLERLDED